MESALESPGPDWALRAEGLFKHYGEVCAVEGVDLHVPRGACLALLGPNGAGKSTTLLMLAGVLAPDAGVIRVAGLAQPTLAHVRQRVGFVPQGIALYPELTARENLEFFGRIQGVPAWQLPERVDRALELAALTDRHRQRVGTFSGGMQRRLNVACATLHGPDVLLLDEPTVGVDPHSRAHMFRSIEKLRESGVTIVYSTHYMEEAERVCTEVAIMDRGRVLAHGTRRALLDEYGAGYTVEAELGSENGTAPLSVAPQRVTRQCRNAEEVLSTLAGLGSGVADVSVTRPDLESVFLRLTGRRLRD